MFISDRLPLGGSLGDSSATEDSSEPPPVAPEPLVEQPTGESTNEQSEETPGLAGEPGSADSKVEIPHIFVDLEYKLICSSLGED